MPDIAPAGLASCTCVQVYRRVMDISQSTSDSSWAAHSCTLPTVEQPIRVAAFDELFADALLAVDRVEATTVDLTLKESAHDRAAELAELETACCSFFRFDLAPAHDGLVRFRVRVPAARVAVLEGFAARAATVAGLEATVAGLEGGEA